MNPMEGEPIPGRASPFFGLLGAVSAPSTPMMVLSVVVVVGLLVGQDVVAVLNRKIR
jgi:hypothetical protein